MKVNEAPEKIYIDIGHSYDGRWYQINSLGKSIEYTRTDAFIEKAAEFLYNHNRKQVLKHGARATLGCGEYTINVNEFKKYMKGE